MTSFLEDVAQYLINKKGNDLSNLDLILPNKRSCVFLRHYLSSANKETLWLPNISDISSYIQKETDAILADQYSLVILLYLSYRELMEKSGMEAEDFDRFYPWGTMILADFDEIDKNLAEAKYVFKFISEIKQIELFDETLHAEQIEVLKRFWQHVETSKNSTEKEKFLETWRLLPELYETFNLKLDEEKMVYEGKMYRDYVGKLMSGEIEKSREKAFAGFNFLNASEKQIFQHSLKNANTIFFWDVDPFFMENKNFPPYDIIREQYRLFPPPADFELSTDNYTTKPRIKSFSVPLANTQCKYLENLLSEVRTESINEIGIILSDEQMLFPLLKSIPEHIDDLNITMGYPMMNTGFADLVDKLMSLRNNVRGKQFFSLNLLKVLKHPLITGEHLKDMISEIEKQYPYFSSFEEDRKNNKVMDLILTDINDPSSAFKYFCNIAREIIARDEKPSEPELSFIEKFIVEVSLLDDVIRDRQLTIQSSTSFTLLKEIMKQIRIPFEGEPLGNTQIMGVLETRCLDFKKIFILNMNEGNWPKIQKSASFIPYNIRKAYGLKTYDRDDNIFAYYFYRLMQRSEEINIFHTSAGEMNEGEKSRYLNQMKYDLNLEMDEKIISHHITLPEKQSIEVEKDDQLMALIKNKFIDDSKILSPSALNTYIDCPLQFYFKHLCEIKEDSDPGDDIDPALFGNMLHGIMQKVYENASEDGLVQLDSLIKVSKKLPDYQKEVLSEVLERPKLGEIHGQLHLAEKVLERYARQIIETDKKYTPFKITGLEEAKYDMHVEIEVQGDMKKIRLGGIIDRIDLKNNILRVIDYKSGADSHDFKSISSMFDAAENNRNKAAMQVLFYCCILSTYQEFSEYLIQGGIYNIRAMFDKSFDSRLSIKEGRKERIYINNIKDHFEEIMTEIKQKLQDIFNPDTPFYQTEETKTCEYCLYKKICQRSI